MKIFFNSNFRRVLNILGFLLFPLHRRVGTCTPMKMEQTECSEMLAYKIQTPWNYPEESTQQMKIYLNFAIL